MRRNRLAPASASAAPRVRRGYFDCRYGQLHVHYAIPSGGGFDEATTLLCIPGLPGSGRFFQPLLGLLGADRSVYAPDLPGFAESDAPPEGAGPAELAQGLLDFLDSMHIRRVDLLAHEQGVAVALALVQQRAASVDRLVLSPSNAAVREQGRKLTRPVRLAELCAPGTSAVAPDSALDLAMEIKEGLASP
ncbi:MAG: alpha/beta fold hydrolase [Steroidobacteraceae bacterium]